MPNITAQSPIRYCIDGFNSTSYGLVISNIETDFSGASEVNGFDLKYSMPSGTDIKFLFKQPDSSYWFKLSSNGARSSVVSGTPDYETVFQKGNTVAELNALTSIPGFAGKKIKYAVALTSDNPLNAIPKIRVAVKATSDTQSLNTSEYSPVYELSDEGQIAAISATPQISGNADVKVVAQIKNTDDSLSEWLSLAETSGRKAKSVQLRADYSVASLNGGQAILGNADITYSDGSTVISGAGAGEIISYTQDWFMNIRHCRMNVRHAPLVDSQIKAFVCFRKSPVSVKHENLGIGSGKRTVFQLKNTNGIKYDTVRLFFDDKRIFSDWEFNSEVARITCTPDEGVIVSCDYEYGWEFEEWKELSLSDSYSLDDYDVSEFRFSRPDSDSESKSVCAVKIQLITTSGNITRESLGKGTGKTRTYTLSHRVKDGNITVYSGNSTLSKNYYSLADDSQFVKIAASDGADISASYEWISESPAVYQFAAVFSQ